MSKYDAKYVGEQKWKKEEWRDDREERGCQTWRIELAPSRPNGTLQGKHETRNKQASYPGFARLGPNLPIDNAPAARVHVILRHGDSEAFHALTTYALYDLSCANTRGPAPNFAILVKRVLLGLTAGDQALPPFPLRRTMHDNVQNVHARLGVRSPCDCQTLQAYCFFLQKRELGRHAYEFSAPPHIQKIMSTPDARNAVQGVIPNLALLLHHNNDVVAAYLCTVDAIQISKAKDEGAHFCGYRNIQMILAALDLESHGANAKIPTIFDLQIKIENAWKAGFNSHGMTQTGGIRGTRKHIGTQEVIGSRNCTMMDLSDIPSRPRHSC